ncbi:GGDEF domain-containing protein [Pseudomonas nitroreducens]|uniref:diguanylate cyclase n=1 Tax=Pseudomonas nitroreducens TaxID=46680 RepID=A0A6G6J0U2_PSENT|nr:GGDEF domain-containing protein [Pseudomonas nitroreducens]MCJ1882871.1 GGDEF domain-containing protein [Pseudomonas nitroreducens]MCJ1898448.1 GGDEF domain-containing protein [Pseudomonas nitroreducens]QIE88939.1 GGDEF domain-containing protein [Pseudomonas nitroreducens]
MSRTLLQRLHHAIAVNDALALPIARENLRRLYLSAPLAVLFDLIHIIVFKLNLQGASAAHDGWRMDIIRVHATVAVLFSLLGLLAWLALPPRRSAPLWYMQLLTTLGSALLLGFGVAITGADQQVTSSITPFLMASVAAALILLMRPRLAVSLYILAFAAFELTIGLTQADPQLRLSNQMGGLTICGIGVILSLILWHGHVRNLRQREFLRQQRLELEEKNRQLEYLAGHDPLTGLFNRRQFDQLVGMELSRAARQPAPISLLMVDLDHFKFINDRYGHPLGDEVIRHTATLLRNYTRTGDSVARLGGEEFLLLLPDTSQPQARTIAEKVRRLLEETPLPMKDGLLYLTASFGIACLEAGTPGTYEGLYAAADKALYKAKASGRNRVEVIELGTEMGTFD